MLNNKTPENPKSLPDPPPRVEDTNVDAVTDKHKVVLEQLLSPDSWHRHKHRHRHHDEHHHSHRKHHHRHHHKRDIDEKHEESQIMPPSTKKRYPAETSGGTSGQDSSTLVTTTNTSEIMMTSQTSSEESRHGMNATIQRPGAFRIGGSDTDRSDSLLGSNRDVEQGILPSNSNELTIEAHVVDETSEIQVQERFQHLYEDLERMREELTEERQKQPILVPAEWIHPRQDKEAEANVDEQEKTHRWYCNPVFLTLVVCCIGIVVVITTFVCVTDPPPSPQLIKFLGSISPDGGAALSDSNSPQYSAAKWLSEEVNFTSYSNQTVIQRYALATLYYSTNGDEWNQANRWLTGKNECTWELTNPEAEHCSDGAIKMIILDENNLEGQLPIELVLMSNSLGERMK